MALICVSVVAMAGPMKRLMGLFTKRLDQPIIPEFRNEPGRGYRGPSPAAMNAKAPGVIEPHLIVAAPVAGRILALREVPDPSIAQGHLGLGMAMMPSDGLVVAPIEGRITFWSPSAHAVVISNENGLDLMVHIGVHHEPVPDGLYLPQVDEGAVVTYGQPLIRFDYGAVKGWIAGQEGASMAVSILAQNAQTLGYGVKPLAMSLRLDHGEELFSLEPGF